MNIEKRNWSERLENVLNDYDALNQFKNWMGVDDDSSEHPLRLHFAIIAYKEMVTNNDKRYLQLANDIYNKFLRPKLGLCAFIDVGVREQIGRKIRQLSTSCENPSDVFDLCWRQLDTFLRKQHALFVSSPEFLNFFNASNSSSAQNPAAECVSKPINKEPFMLPHRGVVSLGGERRSRKSERLRPPPTISKPDDLEPVVTGPSSSKLTAHSLFRSQRDRETTLGRSSVEKMFQPVSKYPYVANATTSKNDSAVSSTFSASDTASGVQFGHHHTPSHDSSANSSQKPTSEGTLTSRALREEHRRVNPIIGNHFQRPQLFADNIKGGSGAPMAAYNSSTSAFRHDIEEDRQQFAKLLSDKLKVVMTRYKQDEKRQQQIEKIAKGTARDVIISSVDVENASNSAELERCAGLDVDEDVDAYYKQKMLPDTSTNNSMQQSPRFVEEIRRGRRRSPKSNSSPDRHLLPFPLTGAEIHSFPAEMSTSTFTQGASNSGGGGDGCLMSHSCINPPTANILGSYPSNSRHLDYLSAGPNSSSFYYNHKSCSPDRLRYIYPNHPPPYSNFAPPPQQQQQNLNIQQMNQSYSANPQPISEFGFAPPPGTTNAINKPSTTNKRILGPTYKDGYFDNDGDTSGIGSMTTHFSEGSAVSSFTKQKAALFKKAREKFNLSNSQQQEQQQQYPEAIQQQQNMWNKMSEGLFQANNDNPRFEMTPPNRKRFGVADFSSSLPRPKTLTPTNNSLSMAAPPLPNTPSKMTISYKDSKRVPFVANVPQKTLTFKEFRRYLSIPSKHRKQFFFKTNCEDGSAPYQLLLVDDDSTILPTFDGKITAECRSQSDSE